MTKPTLSIIGLGKLGLPFVACWLKKGYTVIGADINEAAVAALAEAKPLSYEPDVAELLETGRNRVTATTNIVQAVRDSQVTFIFVGTPGMENGKFTTEYVVAACKSIGKAIREKKEKQLIVLVSSVTAGSIDGEIIPAIEAASGKNVNTGFDFCYSPVFIALGTMIRDYFNPDLVLIGESNKKAGDRLQELLLTLLDKPNAPIVRTNFVNAELIKLTLSTFVTTKITYANLLTQLCASIPGANVDVVTTAMGLDSRIGSKALRGGMPYGGPCFPRDNRALLYLLDKHNVDRGLVASTDVFNKKVIEWLAGLTEQYTGPNKAVTVLGLAFKPETDVIDESAGIDIVLSLHGRGLHVRAYDPQAGANARRVLPKQIFVAETIEDALNGAQAVLITTAWNEFENILPNIFRNAASPIAVLDPWRILRSSELPQNVTYIPIGRQL